MLYLLIVILIIVSIFIAVQLWKMNYRVDIEKERVAFFKFCEGYRSYIPSQRKLIDKYSDKYGEDEFLNILGGISLESGLIKHGHSPRILIQKIAVASKAEEDTERKDLFECMYWFQVQRWAQDLGLSDFIDKTIEETLSLDENKSMNNIKTDKTIEWLKAFEKIFESREHLQSEVERVCKEKGVPEDEAIISVEIDGFKKFFEGVTFSTAWEKIQVLNDYSYKSQTGKEALNLFCNNIIRQLEEQAKRTNDQKQLEIVDQLKKSTKKYLEASRTLDSIAGS